MICFVRFLQTSHHIRIQVGQTFQSVP
jgi:hypothetical protein